MKRIFTEDDLQKAQVTYLESRVALKRDVLFCAVPNEAIAKTLGVVAKLVGQKLSGMVWGLIQKMKSLGLVSGAMDLIVLLPDGRVLLIENKVKGNKLSASQENFRDRAEALGHSYHLISAETPGDAVTQLEELLGS